MSVLSSQYRAHLSCGFAGPCVILAHLLCETDLCYKPISETALIVRGREKSETLAERKNEMNQIIYIVGLIVVVLFVLGVPWSAMTGSRLQNRSTSKPIRRGSETADL